MPNIKERFIVDESIFNSQRAEQLAEMLLDLNISTVTKEGNVLLHMNSITNIDKIGLVIISRFIANHLESTIPGEVTLSEITSSTSLTPDIVSARAAELVDRRIIRRVKNGSYIAVPSSLETFIKKLASRYTFNNGKS
ncbi:hypothetical protein KW805_02920 [Candidatus Pacearchaeota archaeon]|nr:hypothetical protein [Candidatus Pacearchaeota archaeon]